jgi:DinB superfamily
VTTSHSCGNRVMTCRTLPALYQRSGRLHGGIDTYHRRMELRDAMLVLARTPKVLRTLLTGLPPQWVHRNDGPGTWSAYDIVGHLLHGDAANWLPRTRMILQHGTGRPFEPFDREAMLRQEREPVEAVLARFQDARLASLDELASFGLTAGDLERRGTHPELGEVSAGQVLATWVAHDLTHLAQIGEVLARRYRDDVGPYRAFMPALDRTADAE